MLDNSSGEFRRDIPMQTRLAPVMVKTAKDEARTIDVVFTTGARVRRYDWWSGKRYDEELEISAKAMDLSRLNGGAPLLNTHGSYDLGQVLGVVERAWIDGAEGLATLRFSERADVQPFWHDVKSGIIRNVSIGYTPLRYEITEEEGKPPLYRAVEWQPYEISMVPVPADAGAGTRSQPAGGMFHCTFVQRAAEAAARRQRDIDILRLAR